ncbi:MAG: YqeG family HAD IIIA-type phosphatase [Coprococcus sp.]
MFKKFYPKEYYTSTYKINFKEYYDKGFRGILFDIDNTLVPHDAPADERAIELIRQLKDIGFKICLVSNNKEPRVAEFNQKLNVEYIYKAGKPLKKGYLKAMNIISTNVNNTLFVGDQLFTDLWGANATGIHSILVMPINKKEEIQIVLKRIPEKLILFFYKRKHRIIQ